MHGDHWCHLDLQPPNNLSLQFCGWPLGLNQRNLRCPTGFDHAAVRLDGSCIDDAWHRILRECCIFCTPCRPIKGHKISCLYITDNLYSLRIKLVKEARQLQRRPVYIGDCDIFMYRIHLWREIYKMLLLDEALHTHLINRIVHFVLLY